MHIKELTQQTSQNIEVNGKTIEVRLTIEVSYDDCFALSDFESEVQVDLGKKIDRGQITPVIVQVLGHIDGHLFGIDSLGGVLMETKQDIEETVKYYDMVQNCLNDAKNNLTNFLNKVA